MPTLFMTSLQSGCKMAARTVVISRASIVLTNKTRNRVKNCCFLLLFLFYFYIYISCQCQYGPWYFFASLLLTRLPCALLFSTRGVLFRNTRLRRKTGRYGRIDSRESSHGVPSILTFGHLTYLNIRRADCVLFLTAVSLISSILTLSKTDAFYSQSFTANTRQHSDDDDDDDV